MHFLWKGRLKVACSNTRLDLAACKGSVALSWKFQALWMWLFCRVITIHATNVFMIQLFTILVQGPPTTVSPNPVGNMGVILKLLYHTICFYSSRLHKDSFDLLVPEYFHLLLLYTSTLLHLKGNYCRPVISTYILLSSPTSCSHHIRPVVTPMLRRKKT